MRRILVVDDDPGSRELICKLLEDSGYIIDCAENGWEGLLALDKAAADLILLDIAMPGMNGTTFLGIIRNDVRRVGIPVIVITALEPEDLRARVADLNVGVILEKGDTQFVDKLLAAVRSGLN